MTEELSPRDAARAACPPGRLRALLTLDELRRRRRWALELDRLRGDDEVRPHFDDPERYVQPHDGYRPSRLLHNRHYGP